MKKTITAGELTRVAMGVALTAVCSWISVPSLLPSLVPFTMQTFAVCLLAGVFGRRTGVLIIAVYVLLGAVGVPVFSGFRGGLGVLLGTTGGYIIGFLFTALAVGWAADRWGRDFGIMAAAMALGVVLCYAFGTVWFTVLYARINGPVGVMTALSWCVFPYLVPDGIKIALAAALAKRLSSIIVKA